MNELEPRGGEVEAMTPEQLGGEIRLLTGQARRMALSYAIQIGYRLKIAHDKVGPHGWADWLKKETDFSQAAASRLQALYEGYGEDQGNLFGVGNKFPTLENISISNALRLLAVPEEEREQVALEVDAEHISARELERALAERDEARRAAEEAETRAKNAEDLADRIADERVELQGALHQAEHRIEDAEKRAAEKLAEAQRQIKELEARPVEVAVERDEAAIKEAADAARKAAEDAARADLDKLRAKLDKAEKARKKAEEAAQEAEKHRADDIRPYEETAKKAREEAEQLRKKLLSAESGANVAATLFSLGQQNFSAALEKVSAMKNTHPDTAAKLLTGMEQILSRLLETIKEART